MTRAAAFHVIQGDDLDEAARRISQTPEFLENHIRSMLMPALYA